MWVLVGLQVYELDHGESMQFCKGKLEITGTIGMALPLLVLPLTVDLTGLRAVLAFMFQGWAAHASRIIDLLARHRVVMIRKCRRHSCPTCSYVLLYTLAALHARLWCSAK